MRKTKFRVWNQKLKEMYLIQKDNYFCQTGFLDQYRGNQDAVWMQYTGIDDKNGEEICEGDIVKRKGLVLGSIDITGTVKMLEGCWVIDSGVDAIKLWTECDENEIIGNIYENFEI